MTIVTFVLMAIAFKIENEFIGIIAAMAIMVIGVYVLSEGVQGIENLLTIALGSIFVGFGAYVFLNTSLERIQDLF